MKIAIGSDHAGFVLKQEIIKHLKDHGYEVIDVGTESMESVDYPDYAMEVAKLVGSGSIGRGILICGTGIGMSIAANKVAGVRAALVDSVELARLSREHNDANVLALGSRIINEETAVQIVDTWLAADYAGGRHQQRIDKIIAIEKETQTS